MTEAHDPEYEAHRVRFTTPPKNGFYIDTSGQQWAAYNLDDGETLMVKVPRERSGPFHFVPFEPEKSDAEKWKEHNLRLIFGTGYRFR